MGHGDPEERAQRVAMVIPTYNRAAALSANLPEKLELHGIDEVLVVIDGGTDDSRAVLAALADPRLRIIEHAERRGQSAARNTGWQATDAEWVLFSDDDDTLAPDFVERLMDAARDFRADIVGAPWLHLGPDDDADERAARSRRAARGRPSMRTGNGWFPPEPMVTPFLPPNVLVRREVLDVVAYDESYTGNMFREETAFFVSAAEAGFRCVLTPSTYSLSRQIYGGGAHSMSRLKYEFSALHNNHRFLRRHADYLRREGYVRSIALSELVFAWDRVRPFLIARANRLWARLPGGASKAIAS